MRISSSNIHTIKNSAMAHYAKRYAGIDKAFCDAVAGQGLQFGPDRSEESEQLLNRIMKAGVQTRNVGKSLFLNSISPACHDCRTGLGANTFILSLNCNRDCFFCSNRNQLDAEYAKDQVNDVISDFEDFRRTSKQVNSVALTGGEPLLYPQQCIQFYHHVKQVDNVIHTRLYTNGDLLKPEVLQGLAGQLDEIRVSTRLENGSFDIHTFIEQLRLCQDYVPQVTVEMPVLPGSEEQMMRLLDDLNSLNIFSVNLLEFLFPWQQQEEYFKRGYRIKHNPYRVLYRYDYAGGLPVDGSEIAILKCLLYAAERQFSIGIHYCSLENKLTSQVYGQNNSVRLSALETWSQEDFFIKTVKVFGKDVEIAKRIFAQNHVPQERIFVGENYLEFSLADISLLAKSSIEECCISYQIVESDGQEKYLREIQLDKVSPSDYVQR